jgi:hypothetical protein
MPGTDGARLYCSTVCKDAATQTAGSQNTANLDGILKTWRERAGESSYVDTYLREHPKRKGWRAPPDSSTDPTTTKWRGVLPVVVKLPEVGDEFHVPCPHCEGPMYVTARVQDSVIAECPVCSGKKGKSL